MDEVCGLERCDDKLPNIEKEKKLYNSTLISADTPYCHLI